LVQQCTYIYYITSIVLKGMTPPEFIKRHKCSFKLELDNTFSINQSFKSMQVHFFHWCKHEMVLMLVNKKTSDLWKCRAFIDICCTYNCLHTISYLRVDPWALRLYHPEALLHSLRRSRRLYSGAEGWYNLNAHG
jgi:hypothetical protein